MGSEPISPQKVNTLVLWANLRASIARVPPKARVVLGLFLVAAVLMALHTAFSARDSSLHLRVQHSYRSGQISVRVDGDLVYSGNLTGGMKKKFGLIPLQGSLSETVPIPSGSHQLLVRVTSDDGAVQDSAIRGDFARNGQRTLAVAARGNAVSLSWQGSSGAAAESPAGSGWLQRYAGSLFMTIAGSIVSAIAGFALRELPKKIAAPQAAPNSESAASGR